MGAYKHIIQAQKFLPKKVEFYWWVRKCRFFGIQPNSNSLGISCIEPQNAVNLDYFCCKLRISKQDSCNEFSCNSRYETKINVIVFWISFNSTKQCFDLLYNNAFEGQSPSKFCVVEFSKLTLQNIIQFSNISHGLEFTATFVEN